MMEIIASLEKGEKSITQLVFTVNSARGTIETYVRELHDELVIVISRKDGKEAYYKINPYYFITAKEVVTKAYDEILRKQKNIWGNRKWT